MSTPVESINGKHATLWDGQCHEQVMGNYHNRRTKFGKLLGKVRVLPREIGMPMQIEDARRIINASVGE
jgi:hypothetical protein